jgi:predicted DNA-binding transcriptional regulator AlpA
MPKRKSAANVDPLVLDIDQLCQVLQTSKATIARLQAADKLPKPTMLGGQRRWSAETIRRWIAAGMPDAKTWESMRQSTT